MKKTIALLTLGLSLGSMSLYAQHNQYNEMSNAELQQAVTKLENRLAQLQAQKGIQPSSVSENRVVVHQVEHENYGDVYQKLDELQARLNQLYLQRRNQFKVLQKNILNTTKSVQSETEADSLLILVKQNKQAVEKTVQAVPADQKQEYLELNKKLEEQIKLLETYRAEDKKQFNQRYDSLQSEIKNMNEAFHEKIDHEYGRLRDYNKIDTLETKLVLAEAPKKEEVKPTVVEKIVKVKADIPDDDNDGILNDIDKCPNVFGTLKNEGCPETQPQKIKTVVVPSTTTQPQIIERIIEKQPETKIVEVEKRMNFLAQSIFFRTNSDAIQGISQANLNQIVGLMKQFPSSNFTVAGHTDSVGNAAYNKTLSQKRAQAVVNYLIQKGIQPSQLTAIGYGEEVPIAPNNTVQGREQNRRVEIKIK